MVGDWAHRDDPVYGGANGPVAAHQFDRSSTGRRVVRLVGEEASESRSGRDLVLTRLVEVLLIEALSSAA
jgi:hypothetical protein